MSSTRGLKRLVIRLRPKPLATSVISTPSMIPTPSPRDYTVHVDLPDVSLFAMYRGWKVHLRPCLGVLSRGRFDTWDVLVEDVGGTTIGSARGVTVTRALVGILGRRIRPPGNCRDARRVYVKVMDVIRPLKGRASTRAAAPAPVRVRTPAAAPAPAPVPVPAPVPAPVPVPVFVDDQEKKKKRELALAQEKKRELALAQALALAQKKRELALAQALALAQKKKKWALALAQKDKREIAWALAQAQKKALALVQVHKRDLAFVQEKKRELALAREKRELAWALAYAQKKKALVLAQAQKKALVLVQEKKKRELALAQKKKALAQAATRKKIQELVRRKAQQTARREEYMASLCNVGRVSALSQEEEKKKRRMWWERAEAQKRADKILAVEEASSREYHEKMKTCERMTDSASSIGDDEEDETREDEWSPVLAATRPELFGLDATTGDSTFSGEKLFADSIQDPILGDYRENAGEDLAGLLFEVGSLNRKRSRMFSQALSKVGPGLDSPETNLESPQKRRRMYF